MSRFTAQFIVDACAGELRGRADFTAQDVCRDSREDLRGKLYVALRGERFDGHEFVLESLQKGAVAALVDARFADSEAAVTALQNGPLVVVKDVNEALLELAAAHLQRMSARRMALTGSNGKTTTKEMLASIARQALGQQKVVATTGNLNNLIGMPLTALQVQANTELVILEMGMNHPGEIARMAKAATPQYALVNNIHPAHLQGLGDVEGVAQAKGELFAALTAKDQMIVNFDDDRVRKQAERSQAQVLSFGRSQEADLRLLRRDPSQDGQILWFVHQDKIWQAQLAHLGAHNAMNACAAAASALALGIPFEQILQGLANARPVSGRLQMQNFAELRVIDDSYNANPASMSAAIAVAAEQLGQGRLLVALGGMGELGEASAELHQQVGAELAQHEVSFAFLAGEQAEDYARGAVQGGMTSAQLQVKKQTKELIPLLLEQAQPGDLVLIKGSRSAHSEDLVEALRQKFTVSAGGPA